MNAVAGVGYDPSRAIVCADCGRATRTAADLAVLGQGLR